VLNATLAFSLVAGLGMGMAGAALAASLSYTASVVVLALRFARHAGLPRRALLPGPVLWADLRALASRAGFSRRQGRGPAQGE
jgi:Na+-driven multidrug efflux pump